MTQHTPDDLWRDFPKTATEFEKRFATEGELPGVLDRGALGRQAGVRALSLEVCVADPRRHHVECRDCDHQTSLTAGTLLTGLSRPTRAW